jgi:ribonuclease Z
MAKLSVTFLGTSSAAPTVDRGLPSIAVQREGEVVLLDCGEGVQRQVIANRIGLNKDMVILVTHLHGDHVTGLLGLLQTMGLAQRRKPVVISGPVNLLKWLEATTKLLSIGLTFPIEFHPLRPGTVVRTGGFRIRAARAKHSIEAYSFVLEELPRSGVFYPEKARALEIPEGRLWSRLQSGKKVKIGERVVLASQVTGPRRPGRKIGYSGDTRPTSSLVRFFKGVDLLIFDSTFRNSDADKALKRKHSTCVEAALVAKNSGARRLALTHFSARYERVTELVKEAREVFPQSFAAHDGMKVEVPYPDS